MEPAPKAISVGLSKCIFVTAVTTITSSRLVACLWQQKPDVFDISSCIYGDKVGILNPKHDVSLTLTKLCRCLNLTNT